MTVTREGRIGDAAARMLDYVLGQRTFLAEDVLKVPTASYTDPARFDSEIERVFKRVPLMLAFTCELPNPGDFKTMDAVDVPLLISRDRSGQVRAFLNACSHRGAPVARGKGNCSRFVCPYHAWTFGADGQLAGIADANLFGQVDRSGLGLRELPCEERAGMIFACLTPGMTIDLDRHFQGFLEDFEALDFAHWTYLGNRPIEGANWKIAFDGYLEGYHFKSLHPETIYPRTPSNRMDYEAFGPNLRIGFPQHSIADQLQGVAREDWGKRENLGYDFVRIFFPNVSVFIAPEITQVAQLFPGPTPDRNRTILHYLRREPIADDADREAVEGAMDFFRDVTYREDYVIGLDIQKGLGSGAHADLLFGRNEAGNQYFHKWLNWYVAGDASAPAPTL